MQDKKWNLFASVVRSAKSRIISMICRNNEEVLGGNFVDERPEPLIKFR